MNTFKIANLYINTNGKLVADNSWELFHLSESIVENADVKIEFISLLNIDKNIEVSGLLDKSRVIRILTNIVLANETWDSFKVVGPVNYEEIIPMQMLAFYSQAVRHHMLQIHCSIVEYKGVGILFLGPSGIGKTTQAERWAEYRNALIINGDIGYVEKTENGFLAWGTPWHGSSPYCVNKSVPVAAMVVLKQSSENTLRRLRGFEMVTEVSGSVFYPTWLEDGMELCTATLNDLLTTVPVYLLENKADEEAVNLLADELGLS